MARVLNLLIEDGVGVNVKFQDVSRNQKDRRLAIGANIEISRRAGPDATEVTYGNCRPGFCPRQEHGLKSSGNVARIIGVERAKIRVCERLGRQKKLQPLGRRKLYYFIEADLVGQIRGVLLAQYSCFKLQIAHGRESGRG